MKKAGFVALIGEPNSGKSTLLNHFVGSKVSIVTHKVQTTRARIRGIVIEGNSQIVFVDTPGLFKPRRRLDRAMVAAAWGGAADADAIVLLIEAPATGNNRSLAAAALGGDDLGDVAAAALVARGGGHIPPGRSVVRICKILKHRRAVGFLSLIHI